MTTSQQTWTQANLDADIEEEVDIEQETQVEKLWKVIGHDDPFTTMEFVVRIIVQVFKKPVIMAEMMMWEIHNDGRSIIDALPKAEAERKVRIATLQARMEGFPFRLSIEQD